MTQSDNVTCAFCGTIHPRSVCVQSTEWVGPGMYTETIYICPVCDAELTKLTGISGAENQKFLEERGFYKKGSEQQ